MEKYITKKLKNQDLVKYIVKHVSSSSLNNISACGEFLAFIANGDLSKMKLYHSNFCKNRFCPMCSWRQTKKDALKISVLLKYLEIEHKKNFIFLSLTAPNVTGDKLTEEITRYNKAFKKMFERKNIVDINKGYIRKLEITYSRERDDYHPHFHVIIAVNDSYYKKGFIKQREWLSMWRDVMNAPEITQVDVRKLEKHGENKEVLEIATYTAKDNDLLLSQEVFDNFYKALKGRQILTYNGLFKDANKLYKQNKLDKYKEIDNTDYVYFLLHRWGKGEYVQEEFRELTELERNSLNKKLINEADVD